MRDLASAIRAWFIWPETKVCVEPPDEALLEPCRTLLSFNHPQFAGPGSTIGTATAGIISSLQYNTPMRQIQIAMKLNFRFRNYRSVGEVLPVIGVWAGVLPVH